MSSSDPSPDNVSSNSSFLLEAFADAFEPEGFQIKGYEIEKEIDRGGMGIIYLARQLKPDREVALKVMLPKYVGEEEMQERFQREAQSMAALDHPGILPVYEVGTSDSFPFFSMKLARGGSLAEKLDGEHMSPREAASLLREMAEAVHHAHQRGVLHRDLKPGNFLFDSKGQVFVSDFGVAKGLDKIEADITHTSAIVGTPHYLAPEIASGVSKATIASDIYGLGAVFYQCLSGIKPFGEHENLASHLRAIVDNTLPSPRQHIKGIPRDLETICLKALEKTPSKRYSSAASLADDLKRWQEGYAIHARPVHPIEWIWRWCKRHVLASALLAALVLLAIASSVVVFQKNEKQKQAEREQLFQSFIAQANLERLGATPGFRQRSLELLHQANALKVSSRVCEEVVATLTKVDLTPHFATNYSLSEPWTLATPQPAKVLRRVDHPNQDWSLTFYDTGEAGLWKKSASTPTHLWSPQPGYSIAAEFLSTSSRLLVSGAGEDLLVFQGENYQEKSVLTLPEPKLFLAASPDHSLVALGGTNSLSLYSAEDHSLLWEQGEQNVRCSPVWSPDGRYLATALNDEKEVTILDASTGESVMKLWTTGWPQMMAFSPDQRLLAVGCDGNRLLVLDLITRKARAEFQVDAEQIGFSSSPLALWARDLNGTVQQWNVNSAIAYRDWENDLNAGRNTTVHSVQLSPDGKWLLLTDTLGVEIWSVEKGVRTGFYSSQNQRIDAPTKAWWLPETGHQILLQVPGAWDVLQVNSEGGISFSHPWEDRIPGAFIRHIFSDSTWLVEEIDEDGNRMVCKWPSGSSSDSQEVDEADLASQEILAPLIARSGDLEAKVLANNTIRISNQEQPFLLTPPWPISIYQILFVEEGKRLLAIGVDRRIAEWNLPQLEEELKKRGFR